MSMKHLLSSLLSFGFITTATALPPPNVIASCKDEKPYNSDITMSELTEGGFIESSDKNCSDQFEIYIGEKMFGYVNCKKINYIIADGKRIRDDSAFNMSVHPGIKPGTLIPDGSNWWKINDKTNDYLCIAGPLSETGKAATHKQYYILENAFNSEKLEAYFLFFDRPWEDD
jgi:hypothetical protein